MTTTAKRIGTCVRCGVVGRVDRHHRVMRMMGGGDEDENLEDRCLPCHQHIHATPPIVAFLEFTKTQGQADRIAVAELRLSRHEEYNSPERIRERGTYKSYWEDEDTHFVPLLMPTPELRAWRNKNRRKARARDKAYRAKQ